MAKSTKPSYSDIMLNELHRHLDRHGLPLLKNGKLQDDKPTKQWLKLVDLYWKASGMWKKANRG